MSSGARVYFLSVQKWKCLVVWQNDVLDVRLVMLDTFLNDVEYFAV